MDSDSRDQSDFSEVPNSKIGRVVIFLEGFDLEKRKSQVKNRVILEGKTGLGTCKSSFLHQKFVESRDFELDDERKYRERYFGNHRATTAQNPRFKTKNDLFRGSGGPKQEKCPNFELRYLSGFSSDSRDF